ncbi:ParA family partition ATPase [Acinetobacter proteolyticus]|uniref:Peptide transporter n=1 Tax=Acinetobacter proteolyticus TaxID=1776741 RepID=A0A2N0WID4_9GAMM|nr:ParA family partition ATPase [Acinetobacter proteolyticus]PKF35575.1 peptide transporter [Acinetobacter proteolyticus]
MAFTIAVLNQKGGAGKTTITMSLAGAFTSLGYSVAIVDSDTQGNMRDWKAVSEENPIPVFGIDRPTIHTDIKALSKFDINFIDGAPTVEAMSASAIKAADLVLIPVQPSPLDIWATADLVEMVKTRIELTDGKLQAAFIVSRSISSTKISKDISTILSEFELPVLETPMQHYTDLSTCIASGKTIIEFAPRSKAAKQVMNLANEIITKFISKAA